MRKDYTKKFYNAIEIHETQIQDQFGELDRGIVEDNINAMPDAEADALCNTTIYEHSKARKEERHVSWLLQTKPTH